MIIFKRALIETVNDELKNITPDGMKKIYKSGNPLSKMPFLQVKSEVIWIPTASAIYTETVILAGLSMVYSRREGTT